MERCVLVENSSCRFSGHQSFAFRNTWLTKGVLGCAQDSSLFRRDNALVTLGVGKNMVDSIRYWCLATQVIELEPGERNNRGYYYRPTEIGRRIFLDGGGWDPYLEDSATLWLLHYLLATNPAWATTAYHVYNKLNTAEFSRQSLEARMLEIAETIGTTRASANTIRRDVNVLIHMYAGTKKSVTDTYEDSLDCPLAELGLVHAAGEGGSYRLTLGDSRSLPDAMVAYATMEYALEHGGRTTFSLDELAYQPKSPGRVFRLGEAALALRVERLAETSGGAWQVSETAGLRQVTIGTTSNALDLLDKYYAGQGSSHCV